MIAEVKPVMLLFRPNVPRAQRASILRELAGSDGIADARALLADATHPEVARMAYVYVEEGVDIATICRRLESLDEIESASIPAARHLV